MWQVKWRSISSRIEGLLQAASLGARLSPSTNMISGVKYLVDELFSIAATIESFEASYREEIPPYAAQRLTTLISLLRGDLAGQEPLGKVQLGVPLVAALRGEMQYLLEDTEVTGRSLVVRAFEHLQRCIVADPVIRQSWQDAFNLRETECEKLGACHLLWHGVWAFKANSEGERTDLVLGTPLSVTPRLRAAADVFALTEWKPVKALSDVEQKHKQALAQAKRYGSGFGSLAGFELSSRRFLVMITEDLLTDIPAEVNEGLVTYECVNLAVNPSIPSKPIGRRS